MSDEKDPDREDAAAAADWDTHNDTQSYAAGESPEVQLLSGLRPVAFEGAAENAAGHDEGWQEPGHAEHREGAERRSVGQQMRSQLVELDDVSPEGFDAWTQPENRTQTYGAAPASLPPGVAEGTEEGFEAPPQTDGWGAALNETQRYSSPSAAPAPSPRAPSPPAPSAPGAAGWDAQGNRTQRYAPAQRAPGAKVDPGESSRESGAEPWKSGAKRTQSYVDSGPVAPSPAAALAPPREESTNPWGSPDNNTQVYSPPASAATRSRPEGTEPNPPAPRYGTQPYGQPLSTSEGSEEIPGAPSGATTLEEAARLAADEVGHHRPAPRPPTGFAEIDSFGEDDETLDTPDSPADSWLQSTSGSATSRQADDGTPGPSGEGGAVDDTDKWMMPPPRGVPSSESPQHRSRQPKPAPDAFALAPPSADEADEPG